MHMINHNFSFDVKIFIQLQSQKQKLMIVKSKFECNNKENTQSNWKKVFQN